MDNRVVAREACKDDPCSRDKLLRPKSPAVSLDPASIQALVQALALGPPLFVQDVARNKPVHGSVNFFRYVPIVVEPNAATGDTTAISSASFFRNGVSFWREQAVGNAIPPTVSDFVEIFTETLPHEFGLRLTKFGARSHSGDMIRYQVNKNGQPIQFTNNPSNPSVFEFNAFGDPSDPIDVFADYDPTDTISVAAMNKDLYSAYFVEIVLMGYLYPKSKAGQSGRETQNRYFNAAGLVE